METLKSFSKLLQSFCDAENPFRGLELKYTRLVEFEIANYVLAYITGATYNDDAVHCD